MIVRLATPADAQAFACIHVRGWQAAYQGLINQTVLDDLNIETKTAMWQQTLARPNAGTRITVCEKQGQVVAWSTHGPRRDSSKPEGEIMGLYADPKAWGTGAGPLLLQEALQYLDSQWERSVVWVLTGNVRATKAYEKFGFTLAKENIELEGHPEATQDMLRRTRP